jgi:hypothetical protein
MAESLEDESPASSHDLDPAYKGIDGTQGSEEDSEGVSGRASEKDSEGVFERASEEASDGAEGHSEVSEGAEGAEGVSGERDGDKNASEDERTTSEEGSVDVTKLFLDDWSQKEVDELFQGLCSYGKRDVEKISKCIATKSYFEVFHAIGKKRI